MAVLRELRDEALLPQALQAPHFCTRAQALRLLVAEAPQQRRAVLRRTLQLGLWARARACFLTTR